MIAYIRQILTPSRPLQSQRQTIVAQNEKGISSCFPPGAGAGIHTFSCAVQLLLGTNAFREYRLDLEVLLANFREHHQTFGPTYGETNRLISMVTDVLLAVARDPCVYEEVIEACAPVTIQEGKGGGGGGGGGGRGRRAKEADKSQLLLEILGMVLIVWGTCVQWIPVKRQP